MLLAIHAIRVQNALHIPSNIAHGVYDANKQYIGENLTALYDWIYFLLGLLLVRRDENWLNV